MNLNTICAIVVGVVFVAGVAPAFAQGTPPVLAALEAKAPPRIDIGALTRPLRGAPAASAATRWDISFATTAERAKAQSGSRRTRSKARIVAGALLGAAAGFFAGGFLGAHLEGDRCDCDDPGFLGFVVGAPVGAAAGAIVGGKLLF